jgi:hypothetical protein
VDTMRFSTETLPMLAETMHEVGAIARAVGRE